MNESTKTASGEDAKIGLEALIADILSHKISLFDLLRSAPDGDYWAAVQNARFSSVLLNDLRIVKHFSAELRLKIEERGGDPDDRTIEKELARKDGSRRFPKLVEQRTQALREQPSLLRGDSFEECLRQYEALLTHVEKLWSDACKLYVSGNFPLATFISILVIEEIGKLARLSNDLIAFDAPRIAIPGTVERSHRLKHFVGVVSGALINARLDRVLGKDAIRKVLHQAESNELEKLRQRCLYVDLREGRTVIPSECVDSETARIHTVLAGELMAEVLGHFPWEFERMIENVIAFERAIGMPDTKIARS